MRTRRTILIAVAGLALIAGLMIAWRICNGLAAVNSTSRAEEPVGRSGLTKPAETVPPTKLGAIAPGPKGQRSNPSGPPAAKVEPSRLAEPPDKEALIEIDKVSLMIRDFRTIAGENPVGTNAEIMATVMGGNPKQAKLGPPEGVHLNANGELIDRWGTPYFFHQLSHDHMEIRSAGPDRTLWTEDDPVIN